VQLHVVLVGDNGAESIRQVEYRVPAGALPGPLYFTVADGNTANLADFRQILTATPHTPGQLITTVNNLHPNNKAYVRVWRNSPAFQLEGAELPDPPASAVLILEGAQAIWPALRKATILKLRRWKSMAEMWWSPASRPFRWKSRSDRVPAF